MSGASGTQDTRRWPAPRSFSARSTLESGATATSPIHSSHHQQWQIAVGSPGGRQPSSKGECSLLVAWPEDETDSASLLLQLLQPRRARHVASGLLDWAYSDGTSTSGPGSDSLNSRAHSDIHSGGGSGRGRAGLGGNDPLRVHVVAKARELDDGSSSSPSPARSTRRWRAGSLSAHSLHPRPDWAGIGARWPRPHSPSGDRQLGGSPTGQVTQKFGRRASALVDGQASRFASDDLDQAPCRTSSGHVSAMAASLLTPPSGAQAPRLGLPQEDSGSHSPRQTYGSVSGPIASVSHPSPAELHTPAAAAEAAKEEARQSGRGGCGSQVAGGGAGSLRGREHDAAAVRVFISPRHSCEGVVEGQPSPQHEHQQKQPPQQRAAAPRHPPQMRVAIGLLPSPLQSPLSSRTPGSATETLEAEETRVPSTAATAAAIAAASAPTDASAFFNARLRLSTRSRRVMELPPPSSPSAPQPQQPIVPSLPGLPSFLGAPVVSLDPHPALIHSMGPGTPAPALRTSPSLSTSGPDRAMSVSTSLLAVPLAPSRSPSQVGNSLAPADFTASSTSFRHRLHMQQHSPHQQQQQQQHPGGICGGVSSRFIGGRSSNGYYRTGSYFQVREAVPEAVLDSLPGMQAARGLPPQPQHPGAVPDDLSPPPAPSQATGPQLPASMLAPTQITSGMPGHSTCSFSGCGIGSGQRYGLDLISGAAALGSGSGGEGEGSVSISGRLLSNSSSARTTTNGYPISVGGGGNPNWLRREEAMPPPNMLPIAPSPPPVGMDDLQTPAAAAPPPPPAVAVTRLMMLEAQEEDDALKMYGGGNGLVEYDESWAAVPAAAVMAAMAAAASPTSLTGQVGGGSPQRPLHDVEPNSPMTNASSSCDGSSSNGDVGGGGAISAAVVPSSEDSLPASSPNERQLRPTFRCQSKLRMLSFAHLGLDSGDNVDVITTAAGVAAISEQEALLALLGSSRMMSSVLTATSNPIRVTDAAVHGVRDPRYDHSRRFAMIPEHIEAPAGDAGACNDATADGSSDSNVITPHNLLLGNTRMGSTVFSPPLPAMSRLVASLRQMKVGRSGNGGGRWTTRSASATLRSAMPDLELLSRRAGSSIVVGHDGRSLDLLASGKVFTSEPKIELQPTEQVVSAVSGHRSCSTPQSPAGEAPSFPFTKWREDLDDLGTHHGALCSFRPLAAVSGGTLAASSLDGPSPRGSGNGGGGGGVPVLLRQLSAPARRLAQAFNSGMQQPASPMGAAAAGSKSPFGGDSGRLLTRKPSLIAAGIRMLRRAFTQVPALGRGSSSHSLHVSGGGGVSVPPDHYTTAGGAGGASDVGDEGRGSPNYTHTASGDGTSGGLHANGNSRRRLHSSQRSFLRHSAVLGWVEPAGSSAAAPGIEEEGGRDGGGSAAARPAAVESEVMSERIPPSRTNNNMVGLTALQSLLSTGGGQLTCDAVVAFNAGEGGGSGDADGGVAAAAVRSRHARGAHLRRGDSPVTMPSDTVADTGCRIGPTSLFDNGQLSSFVSSSNVLSGGCTPTSTRQTARPHGLADGITPFAAEAGGGGAHGNVKSSDAAAAAAGRRNGAVMTADAAVGAAEPLDLRPNSSICGDDVAALAAASGVQSSLSLSHPPLLTRIGSKLIARNGRRGSAVFPVLEVDRDVRGDDRGA